jgi:parvulin-like peptidyl-prolyl isomerase
VRNEILSREAIGLGLDKDDVIVKRRLAQKMEFLTDDVSNLREPTQQELRAWFDNNKSEFVQPSRVTFRHVFFSTDRRGATAEAAANKALASAAGRGDAAVRGDPFMFQDHYNERTEQQVAEVFGLEFTATLFSAPIKRWSGPLASGLGWHIVWIEDVQTGEARPYEDAEAEVRERWSFEQREAVKRASFEAMLARYEVVLPGIDAVSRAIAPRSMSVK